MFCKTCGNELREEAVICHKCGCEVEGKKLLKNSNFNIANKWLLFFKYISVICICLTIICIFAGLFFSEISVYEGFSYYGNSGIHEAYFVTNYGSSVLGIVMASLGLLFSFLGCVVEFKSENKNQKFATFTIFIISITMFILSIFNYCCC